MAGFRGEIVGDMELGRLIMPLASQDTMSFSCKAKPLGILRINERTGNVYENKGEESGSSKVEESNARGEPSGHPGPSRELLDCQLSTSRLPKMNERSANVYENKGEESRSSRVEESNARGEPSVHPGPSRELLDCQLSTSRLRKMNERSANVYENKGQLWKTRELSLNVFENKGT